MFLRGRAGERYPCAWVGDSLRSREVNDDGDLRLPRNHGGRGNLLCL
jgi:hypothetical protein